MKYKLPLFLVSAFAIAATTVQLRAAEPLSVAVNSVSPFAATAFIAKQKGFFEREGLDVTVLDVGGGTNVVASIVGGSAQIGTLGIGNLVQARSKGQNIKAFATATRGFPNYIMANAQFIKSSGLTPQSPLVDRIKALKDKTIAVNDVGGSAGDFVRDLLARGGLTESEVTIINIPSGAGRLAALKAGRVDAAVAYSPEPETAKLEGYGDLFIDALKDIPETTNVEWIMYSAKADYISSHGANIQKFVKALDAAADLVANNSDDAKAAYFKEMELKNKGASIKPELQDLIWTGMRAYIAHPATIVPASLERSRTYFKIPENMRTEDLTAKVTDSK